MAESAQCRLLGGFFSTFIQGCLAFLCIGTLIIKRQNEVPRRDWYVWFLDVMKQGIGSSFGHFSNIFLSVVIADSLPNADECQWYCLTYVVDSTIGTTLNLAFLHCFEKAIARFPACGTMDFGDYGDPPSLKIWGGQLAVWLTIVVLGKIIILTVLFHFLKPIDSAMQSVFSVFKNEPELELVMVMIIIPTILNTVQFWVTDTFLKKKEEIHTTLSDNDLDEDLISEEVSHTHLLFLGFVDSINCIPVAGLHEAAHGRKSPQSHGS